MMDEVLQAILKNIDGHAGLDAFTRKRGSMARGVAWGEISGRMRDGAWAELRLHYTPATGRLTAGLLMYQPLARGGRTVSIGDVVADEGTLEERQEKVGTEICRWLDRLAIEL